MTFAIQLTTSQKGSTLQSYEERMKRPMANVANTHNIPESHKDLLSAPVGVLATNGADGFPQVSALWFLYEDDAGLRLSLNTTRQKVKNLQKSPEVTFFAIDPANPYRTLEIRARAEINEYPDG